MQRAVRDAFAAHWRLLMFQGVVMIILGVLAVAAPVIASIAIDIYVGWLFLFSGVIGLIALFSSHHIPAFLWSLITAALSIALGILLIWKPVEGALSLTFVLTAFFLVEGVFQIATSLVYREFAAGHMGLDAGERRLGSAVGRDHRSRLAGDWRLGSGPPRRHQLDHVGLGDRDDGLRRAPSDQDGERTPRWRISIRRAPIILGGRP